MNVMRLNINIFKTYKSMNDTLYVMKYLSSIIEYIKQLYNDTNDDDKNEHNGDFEQFMFIVSVLW